MDGCNCDSSGHGTWVPEQSEYWCNGITQQPCCVCIYAHYEMGCHMHW